MDNGNRDDGFQAVAELMKRIGAEDDSVSSALFQLQGGFFHKTVDTLSVPGPVQSLDITVVEGIEQKFGESEVPQALITLFIDQAIVLRCGDPACPAD
jgi:hypothetical protein